MTKKFPAKLLILIIALTALDKIAGAAQVMEIWPGQVGLTMQSEVAVRAGLARSLEGKSLNIRLDTQRLGGVTWRLWVAPKASPGGPGVLPVQAIRWEGRSPFVNGTLSNQQRVLAGQGPVDGRPVQGQLIFWAEGQAPAAGRFLLPLEFVLETLP